MPQKKGYAQAIKKPNPVRSQALARQLCLDHFTLGFRALLIPPRRLTRTEKGRKDISHLSCLINNTLTYFVD